MPGAERRMHESVYLADYRKVKQFSLSLRSLLDDACSSEVMFSTGDCLTVDLRNRVAGADDGDCTTSGSMINFPSGEGFSAPYEGVGDEKDEFEESLTNGVIPFMVDGELVKGIVSKNKFTVFKGSYFNENPSRRNIAELGIGCNPKAQVTGNMFEDEKAGVHIAYGTSSHLGGKVSSDVHFDLVFAKNCPVEAEKVTLFFENGSFLDIVRNSRLRYELLS
jgi:leucyl aminopeptidase (aminopeptidase T)